MNEQELIRQWNQSRNQLVISQLGPTVLLITTVALLQFGLADASVYVRIGTIGILLASGILGALVQYSVAAEARVIGAEVSLRFPNSPLAKTVGALSRWFMVAQYLTPAIFVGIFIALGLALLA
ncbi:MAG: hypothetical protein ACKORF_05840 [Micrococcales bacterium]